MQSPLLRGLIVLVTSIIAAGGSPAAAQPDPNARVPPPRNAYATPVQSPPSLIDVDFKGGTLAEFVAAIRAAAAPKPLNVMFVADASAERPMPAVTFRQVSINNALDAVSWVKQGDEGQYQVMQRDSGGGEPIYVINYEKQNLKITPMMMQGTPLGAQVEVFMIRDLIEAPAGSPVDPTTILQPDSLLTAVDAVLASVPEYVPKPTVRFHPESATLIVTAPREQLNAIEALLGGLQSDIQERRGRAFAAAARVSDAERRLSQAEVEAGAIREQVETQEAMVQSLQDHVEAIQDRYSDPTRTDIAEAAKDIAAAQSQLAQLRAQFQMKQIEQQVAQSDLEAARQGLGQPPSAAEATAANYHDPIILRARPEFMAIIPAIRGAAPAGGLPIINANTDQGLTITATAPQHAILHAAVEAMKAAAGEPDRPAKNHRE